MGVLVESATGREIPLRGEHVVGRSRSCDLVISAPRVSGDHARLRARPDPDGARLSEGQSVVALVDQPVAIVVDQVAADLAPAHRGTLGRHGRLHQVEGLSGFHVGQHLQEGDPRRQRVLGDEVRASGRIRPADGGPGLVSSLRS